MLNFLKSLTRSARAESAIFRPDMGEPWALLRRSEVETDCKLSEATRQWLAGISEYARPVKLCERHPRIGNQLALLWSQPQACREYLDDLLVDRRGGRTGFAPAIRAEIVRLERYHLLTMSAGGPVQAWRQNVAGE